MADGPIAVYDVVEKHPNRWPALLRREWPAVLEASGKPWSVSDASAHWVNMEKNKAVGLADGTILVNDREWIGHRIEPAIAGNLCKMQLDLWSEKNTSAMFEVVWYDAKGAILSRVAAGASGTANYDGKIFTTVPPNAKAGWLWLRAWKVPVHLKQASVVFMQSPPAAEVRQSQRHSQTTDARGVQ